MPACQKIKFRNAELQQADYPEVDPAADHKFITVKQKNGRVEVGEHPLDYYGPLKENYETYNKADMGGGK